MSSPAKKRKRTSGSDPPSHRGTRTIDAFFARQATTTTTDADANANANGPSRSAEIPAQQIQQSEADEELAHRLQAQWDEEARDSSHNELSQTSVNEKAQNRDNFPIADVNETALATSERHSLTSAMRLPRDGASTSNLLSLQALSNTEDAPSMSLPLDISPVAFHPSQYLAELGAGWHAGGEGHAFYSLLTRAFVLISNTQSRIKIVDTLVNLLRIVIEGDPDSLVPTVWLATNSIGPPYETLELGIAGSAISKALKQVHGLSNASLKSLYDKLGDAGDVAFESKKKQSFTLRKPKPLTIRGVHAALLEIARAKGPGSQEAKQRIVERLLRDARDAEESRFLVRTLVQHLRIGAVKATMLIALARAFLFSRPTNAGDTFHEHPLSKNPELITDQQLASFYLEAEETVKACYARHPNYSDLVKALLEVGVCPELLLRCGLGLHIPLLPMLGSPTRDLTEMLDKLQGREFSCEFKYDGQRAQVHCDNRGKVTLFSRHLEIMTDKYPDLVEIFSRARGDGVSSFILEGEIAAVNHVSGELLPFQTLSNRARKNVEPGSIEINVCLFAFDLMYLNGEPILDRSFRERRDLLRSLFREVPNKFTWVKHMDATSADSESIADFFNAAISSKCEGIMVKVLDEYAPESDSREGDATNLQDNITKASGKKQTRRKALLSTYEPDKRLQSWLKVKKDYNSASDTLDLIPVGGWHGQGRKTKWWSPILLAIRNADTGALEPVCKCMSGFSDKFYQSNKERYAEDSDNVLSRPPADIEECPGMTEPDMWFNPQEVWEIAFADITLSPTYTAALGLVSDERGLSLRFPRFLRVRTDKGVDEASSSEFLASLYERQTQKGPA